MGSEQPPPPLNYHQRTFLRGHSIVTCSLCEQFISQNEMVLTNFILGYYQVKSTNRTEKFTKTLV